MRGQQVVMGVVGLLVLLLALSLVVNGVVNGYGRSYTGGNGKLNSQSNFNDR
jgi:hypothetical protein